MEIKKVFQKIRGWLSPRYIDLGKIKLLEEKGIRVFF